MHSKIDETLNYWFVNTLYDRDVEQYLQKGTWRSDKPEKNRQLVKKMQIGDFIAIKFTFRRTDKMPFQNLGKNVSVMEIKAVGTITSKSSDNIELMVNWDKDYIPKEWYFYTYAHAIVRARIEEKEMARQLVNFTFYNQKQNYAYYLSDPYWAKKYVSPTDSYQIDDILSDGCFLGPGLNLTSI